VSLAPRVVIVHRRSELEELRARHATRAQAKFYLERRGRTMAEAEHGQEVQTAAVRAVNAAIPVDWRRGAVEREDVPRFLFEPEDVVVAVGQDGLVANVAKYLSGQLVIGINDDPERNPGILVQHPPPAAAALIRAAGDGRASRVEERTMVEAVTDDGQRLVALNEVYVGQPTHQTARYTLRLADRRSERQASSGLVVGTGTGATGWCRSLWLERHSALALPAPVAADLAWFVREAWPSPTTGATLTEGLLADGADLAITIESDRLVAFGDGMEADALSLNRGQNVLLRRAATRLRLVAAGRGQRRG
jgi:NAD kinase